MRIALSLATILLGSLAILYVGYGLVALATGPAPDLRKRHLEQRYVWHGIDPYLAHNLTHKRAPAPAQLVGYRLDPIHAGGNPPWTFATGFLFTPPVAFALLRIYFLAVNAVALFIIAAWTFYLGRRFGLAEGVFLVVACLAFLAHFLTLRLGNYAIVVTALLVLVLLTERRGREFGVLQGLLLGIAALKPNIAGAFGIALLARGRWLCSAVCLLYMSFASIAISVWVGTTPWDMIVEMYRQSAEWDLGDAGIVRVLMQQGFARGSIVGTSLFVGSLSAALAAWFLRSAPLLFTFGVVSVIGRLWMYHRRYDNTMLVFLLAALAVCVFQRPHWWKCVVFAMVGVSVWCPVREDALTVPVILLSAMSWLLGAVVLIPEALRTAGARTDTERVDSW